MRDSVARILQAVACLCWICNGLGGKTISFTPTHPLVTENNGSAATLPALSCSEPTFLFRGLAHGVVTAQGATSAVPAPSQGWHRLWLGVLPHSYFSPSTLLKPVTRSIYHCLSSLSHTTQENEWRGFCLMELTCE